MVVTHRSHLASVSVDVLAEGIDHPEAVVWDANREVLFCGGEEGQLYAVDLDGTVLQVAGTGSSLLGLALDEAGLVYGCDAGRRALVVIDPDTGGVTEVSTGVVGRPMIEPNGIALDSAGNSYVTDSGSWGAADGAVFRVGPQGQTELWTATAAQFPNGCLIRAGCLLVVESGLPGLVEIPILADGTAGQPRDLCRLAGCVPDQVVEDTEGSLLVGCYRPDVILRVSPMGSCPTMRKT